MFAIFGSGFGLYGYLPALVRCGQSVILPDRYRERFQSRLELAQFAGNVQWACDEAAALDRANGVVIALRPADQCEWISRCLALPHLNALMLEKPLAPTPSESLQLQTLLSDSKKPFRIGYTFCVTPWAAALREFVAVHPDGDVSISWQFMAHHFRHDLSNWKRSSDTGGGAIRFYGIQLIAALAELGYRDVVESQSFGAGEHEIMRWVATLSGPDVPVCRITVDCRSDATDFSINARSSRGSDSRLFENRDPFGDDRRQASPSGLDSRVGILETLVDPLIVQAGGSPAWYADVLLLWQAVEDCSVFVEV